MSRWKITLNTNADNLYKIEVIQHIFTQVVLNLI